MGLICVEMPEVRFEDTLTMAIPHGLEGRAPLDPLFVGACEAGSIKVVGLVPSEPMLLGATIHDDHVVITRPASFATDGHVNVRVSGIRKGRGGVRFPRFTQDEFKKNTQFWSGWNN
jgi:hypothetical protein